MSRRRTGSACQASRPSLSTLGAVAHRGACRRKRTGVPREHCSVDAGGLLQEAFDRSSMSLAEFAARAGTSRSAVADYLAGRRSPGVRTLNRLLAAAGLQLRATLEPLLADVDERVDAMLAGAPAVDLDALARLVAAIEAEQTWREADAGSGDSRRRTGPVRWALDGATALTLHGLACESQALGVVVEFDGAARAWLTAGLMRCTAPCSDVGGWSSWSLEEVQAFTRELVVGRHGLLALRLVAELSPVLQLRPEGAERCFPVVSVDEVERTQPEHAEVLARLRARRDRSTPP